MELDLAKAIITISLITKIDARIHIKYSNSNKNEGEISTINFYSIFLCCLGGAYWLIQENTNIDFVDDWDLVALN